MQINLPRSNAYVHMHKHLQVSLSPLWLWMDSHVFIPAQLPNAIRLHSRVHSCALLVHESRQLVTRLHSRNDELSSSNSHFPLR
jgi:hypothetical protein